MDQQLLLLKVLAAVAAVSLGSIVLLGQLEPLGFTITVDPASEPLIPPRLVDGSDLIRRGWNPGPSFGRVLTEIQNLQLESKLASRDEALAWLADHYPEQPP